jgi:hypothetical protein
MQMKRLIIAAVAMLGAAFVSQAASAGSVVQSGASAIEQRAVSSQGALIEVRHHGGGRSFHHGGGRFHHGHRRFFRGGVWFWDGYGESCYSRCRHYHGPRYCRYYAARYC